MKGLLAFLFVLAAFVSPRAMADDQLDSCTPDTMEYMQSGREEIVLEHVGRILGEEIALRKLKAKTTKMFHEGGVGISPFGNSRQVGKLRTINEIEALMQSELDKLRPCLQLIAKKQYVGAK